MGMCALRDIFQAKVDELLGDIEDVKIYINDVIALSEYLFVKHIEHLRNIFCTLSAAGLKVNAPKRSFGLNDITYLVHVITREGIKPYTNKLQWIMDLGRPATNIEARALIGMFH